MGMLQNQIKNNPQAQNLLGQIQKMSPEQQAQKIADLCNEKGITIDQLKAQFNIK